MPYEVTATRKRPQGFEQLVGQDFVVSTLKSSLQLDRLAHAYLFSGPRGVGKTSAARILAKALNCENGPTSEPCGVCSQCQEISRGNSLDVIEIDGASNTSVNDIRELKDEVLFAPSNSRYKVYIIDEVHMLSNSAFNALLKTIEEPPPYIVFIFATTEIHKVPATIRSRCQQFNFRLISVEVIKEQLAQAVEEMGIQAEDEALFWIAKEATGSLRDAYTLFDQIASFSDAHITLKQIQEKLGLTGIDSVGELVELLTDGHTGEVIQRTEQILSQGVSIEQFLIDLAEYFRTLLLLNSGIQRESILGYHPDRFPQKIRQAFSAYQLEYAIEQILNMYRDIRFSLNQRFELELLLSKLSSLKDHLSSRELVGKIRELRSELIQGAQSGAVANTGDAGANGAADSRPTAEAHGDPPSFSFDQKKKPARKSIAPQAASTKAKSPLKDSVSQEPADRMQSATQEEPAATEPSDPESPIASAATTAPADPPTMQSAAGPQPVTEPSAQPQEEPPAEPTSESAVESAASEFFNMKEENAAPVEKRQLKSKEIDAVIEEVKERPSLASALHHVNVWELEGSRLELRCDTNYSVHKLQEEIATLKPVAETVLGHNVKITLKVQTTSSSDNENPSDDHGDSQVNLVKKVFRGTIIEGEANESNGHV